MDLFTLKQSIMQAAELGVLAARKRDSPATDEATKGDLYRTYGRRWTDRRIKAGLLTGRRSGSAVNSRTYFSLFEVAALRLAETEAAKLIYQPTKTVQI